MLITAPARRPSAKANITKLWLQLRGKWNPAKAQNAAGVILSRVRVRHFRFVSPSLRQVPLAAPCTCSKDSCYFRFFYLARRVDALMQSSEHRLKKQSAAPKRPVVEILQIAFQICRFTAWRDAMRRDTESSTVAHIRLGTSARDP